MGEASAFCQFSILCILPFLDNHCNGKSLAHRILIRKHPVDLTNLSQFAGFSVRNSDNLIISLYLCVACSLLVAFSTSS